MKILNYDLYQWVGVTAFILAGSAFEAGRHGNWIAWFIIAAIFCFIGDRYCFHKRNG